MLRAEGPAAASDETEATVRENAVARYVRREDVLVNRARHGTHEDATRSSADGHRRLISKIRLDVDDDAASAKALPDRFEGIDHALSRESSERPGEERDVEPPVRRPLGRTDDKADVLELERAGADCRALDLLLVRVERYDRARTRCVLESKATVAAADLEHVAFVEPRQATNEAQLEARRWIAARVLALALSRWPDTACVRLAPAATAPPTHAARDATRDAREGLALIAFASDRVTDERPSGLPM